MTKALRLAAALLLALLVLALNLATTSAAPGRPLACASSLIIYTDPANLGTFSQEGPVTHVVNSGVLGGYDSGLLAGYGLAGSQEIWLNNVTQTALIVGSFVASNGHGSAIELAYTGRADLKTGLARGTFQAHGLSGQLAALRWNGVINAQLIAPLTFRATDSGPCSGAA